MPQGIKRKLEPEPQDDSKTHSAEYYKARRRNFDERIHTQRNLKSKLNVYIKRRFWEFCAIVSENPPKLLQEFQVADLDSFFAWLLKERRSSIKDADTLQTYWNVLCIVRREETALYTLPDDTKDKMIGVRQRLIEEFELDIKKKEKPIMRSEDLFELEKTVLLSTDMAFEHEQLRIELMLYMQIAGNTGNRPGAILALRFRDFKIALVRDPDGGPWPRLVIDTTFDHTKGYRGDKDANTIPILSVPREPCLLLCPQTLFLALAQSNLAFVTEFKSASQIFGLRLRSDQNELHLPFKDSVLDSPVFRSCERALKGIRISSDQPLTSDFISSKIKLAAKITGIKAPVGPYTFRRGAGEAFDNSSNISESQRNLLLQHHNSTVFQKNYLSRHITASVVDAYRGLDQQTALIRYATGISRTIDKRRPWALTPKQRKEIKSRPQVSRLATCRKAYKKWIDAEFGGAEAVAGTEIEREYDQIIRDLRNETAYQERLFLDEITAKFDKEQPVLDITQQLNGTPVDEVPKSEIFNLPAYAHEERTRAVKSLLTLTPKSLEEECAMRAEAIDAVSALCALYDSRYRWRRQQARAVSSAESEPEIPSIQEKPEVSPPLEMGPLHCPFCFHDARNAIEARMKKFKRKDILKRHLNRCHFKPHLREVAMACPVCGSVCEHMKHVQRHGQEAHGIMWP